jgi:ferredoxin
VAVQLPRHDGQLPQTHLYLPAFFQQPGHRLADFQIPRQAIMREANTKGLMQSGEISLLAGRHRGRCPVQLLFRLLLSPSFGRRDCTPRNWWPLTRYQARVDGVRCNACGRCVARCPFKAITLKKQVNEQERASIRIDADLCRGCGVCSTRCREEAISMVKLQGVDSLFDRLDL